MQNPYKSFWQGRRLLQLLLLLVVWSLQERFQH
jgi:hypothetical protein